MYIANLVKHCVLNWRGNQVFAGQVFDQFSNEIEIFNIQKNRNAIRCKSQQFNISNPKEKIDSDFILNV